MAFFRIEKKNNYTVMSNHHLVNKELSLKAKGLFSYMLSRPDDWDFTLEGLASNSKECRDTIGEIVKELERFGYVERRRIRNEEGHLKETEYIIHEEPMRKTSTLDNPELEKPTLDNSTQLNTEELITDIPNTDINNLSNHICEDNELDYISSEPKEKRKDEMDIKSYSYWLKRIHKQIDYKSLEVSYADDIKMINEMIEIMIETMLFDKKTDFINRSNYPLDLVKNSFLSIEYQHIQYILGCFHNTTKEREIKNVKQYLKSMLFNAPVTIDMYYTAKVNITMPWR